MTKTYKDLLEFLPIANGYTGDDKLGYAFKKMINQKNGRLQPAMEQWNELIADLKYDFASLDEKGNLIRNGEILLFTPEKQKALDKAARELRKKTFEFEPYYATDLPKDLDEFVREVLVGFVIKEEVKELQLQENGQG